MNSPLNKPVAITVTLIFSALFIGAKKATPDSLFVGLEAFTDSIALIENHYISPIAGEKLIEAALKGITKKLDPYSEYITADELKSRKKVSSGFIYQVGLEIKNEGKSFSIESVWPNSSAKEAGLEIGDEVRAIGDCSLTPETFEQCILALEGPPKSKVTLHIRPKHREQAWPFTLNRHPFLRPAVKRSQCSNTIPIIRINAFRAGMANELAVELNKLRQSPLLIVDLRGNPGGLLDEAVRAADLFIDEGTLVRVISKQGHQKEEYVAHITPTLFRGRVVVVADRETASAAEVFASALQTHSSGTLFGQPTFGKALVQTFFPLVNGGALKLSVARYLTSDDKDLSQQGLNPDVLIATHNEDSYCDLIDDWWKNL
ncbi:MAG: S41 family peptidase [Myxococcota bacterium]|nr:S41 family peptidase [Myxococcota bacterium]